MLAHGDCLAYSPTLVPRLFVNPRGYAGEKPPPLAVTCLAKRGGSTRPGNFAGSGGSVSAMRTANGQSVCQERHCRGLPGARGGGRARRGWRRWVGGLLLLLGALASGCSNAPRNAAGEDTSQGSMRAGEFLQTDADRMATLAMRDNLQSLYQLLWKLYKRNPAEWKKTGLPSQADAELAIRRAIEQNRELSDLGGRRDIAALSYSLDPAFKGDRVGAFIYSLASMLITAHGGRTEFYVYQGIDAQYVYNAARNVEVATWMLATRKDDKGAPLLLSNALTDDASNLSYAREFAKIVARLDLLAEVLGERYRRISVNYAQGLLFMHFLPVQ